MMSMIMENGLKSIILLLNYLRLKKNYKTNLIKFINSGPDDLHSYQIQVCDLDKNDYNNLKTKIESECDLDSDDESLLQDLYDEIDFRKQDQILLQADGCTDNNDMLTYYCEQLRLNPDNNELMCILYKELVNDNDLYNKVLKDYIDDTYSI